ncbi:unnamed protein product [marine sediment metagenome]|uniref:Uncharacterized protein n=1 Tax=marine sediment metagenome TaxID=412755 RepID=X1RJZ4_9ZZZZ
MRKRIKINEMIRRQKLNWNKKRKVERLRRKQKQRSKAKRKRRAIENTNITIIKKRGKRK